MALEFIETSKGELLPGVWASVELRLFNLDFNSFTDKNGKANLEQKAWVWSMYLPH